jgi:ubiquinone/menaquinone biosynthesis C-methylase UbiE
MSPHRHKGFWYIPGRFYDLAFSGMFRGLRKRVGRVVQDEALYPWLDVCCGTGDQFRAVNPPGLAFGFDLSFGFVRYAAARTPGIPFSCGNAARLPFKDRSLRAVSVSLGLHDKSPELRSAIANEARRVLRPCGKLIVVDFENPWNAKSKTGMFFVRAVEWFAGGEHYRNGKEFLSQGGLRAFFRESGFVEVSRHDIAMGSLSVVVARPNMGIS